MLCDSKYSVIGNASLTDINQKATPLFYVLLTKRFLPHTGRSQMFKSSKPHTPLGAEGTEDEVDHQDSSVNKLLNVYENMGGAETE